MISYINGETKAKAMLTLRDKIAHLTLRDWVAQLSVRDLVA